MTTLVKLLAPVEALLLDFDGPVCSIFAGHPAPVIADQLRQLITDQGAVIPPAMAASSDPLEVLRLSADLGSPELARHVADALRDAEVAAAATAQPTSGLPDVLQAAHGKRLRVAIVSNNSRRAVSSYLTPRGISQAIEAVAARYDGMDPRQLKPSAHLVNLALKELGVLPTAAVLVGDSTSDVRAAHAAGVPAIGYANKPGKHEKLAAAGADAVVADMAELAEALRVAGVPS